MKHLRTTILASALAGLCGAASAIAIQNPTATPTQGRMSQPPIQDKKADAALQMSSGLVKSVNTANLTVTLIDGRTIQLHQKTLVFKGQEKGSIYAISAGQQIEFALDIGADVELAKETRKAVQALKSQASAAADKSKAEPSRVALIRIKPKAEKTR